MSNPAARRILITGANGLVARHIAELPVVGAEYLLTSRMNVDHAEWPSYPFDWCQIDGISAFLSDLDPDIVIHTAGVTAVAYAEQYPEETIDINVRAMEQVAQWCQENRSRLVHFSTDFVFDGVDGMYDETDAPHPLSHYGRSKLSSEEIVLQHCPDAAIIRTVLVYGYAPQLSRLNFPLWLKQQLEMGNHLNITADQYRTPTYAEDLAAATIELALSDHKGLFHISGPEYLSVYDFALRVAEVFDLDATLLTAVETVTTVQSGQRPMKTGFDLSKVQRAIAYHPCDVQTGLQRMKQRMLP